MTPRDPITTAQRDLEAEAKRLARESRHKTPAEGVHCVTHGASYACPGASLVDNWDAFEIRPALVWSPRPPRASCGHRACTRILGGDCPECEAT